MSDKSNRRGNKKANYYRDSTTEQDRYIEEIFEEVAVGKTKEDNERISTKKIH